MTPGGGVPHVGEASHAGSATHICPEPSIANPQGFAAVLVRVIPAACTFV